MFGLLNVNKPAGISSRKVVDRVARAVMPGKAGHAGTLDPMATGVLVVCVGKATRLIEYVQQYSKTYVAQFLLGKQSNTDDITGDVVEQSVAPPPVQSQVERALAGFVGQIQQVPPQFSAVHVNGRRAYKLARKGEDVELKPRTVEVHRVELTRYEFPEIDVEIECGSGTYIRSIGRDFGGILGCGAVMSRLVRTAIGPFRLEDAVALDEIVQESVHELLWPPTSAIAQLARCECTANDLRELSHGRRIPCSTSMESSPVAVIDPAGKLAAIAVLDGPFLQPRHVFCA